MRGAIDIFTQRHAKVVHFELPWGGDNERICVQAPLLEMRLIKSSNGKETRRPVIRTALSLGRRRFTIDATLVDRSQMEFRVLIGRNALAQVALVDPAAKFLLGDS